MVSRCDVYWVELDQVRTVDKKRLKDKMGSIPLEAWHDILIQMLT